MANHPFEKIMSDNVSGSGIILKRIMGALLIWIAIKDSLTGSELIRMANRLMNSFPHFALVFHFVNSLKNKFSKTETVSYDDLQDFIYTYRKNGEIARKQAIGKLTEEVSFDGRGVLLHSHSSTVLELFSVLKKQAVQPVIWQTVSSPVGEGVIQAKKLAAEGFDVHLFHEDAISLFIEKIDMAVFGADMVMSGFFVNKTGTFPLAMMLQHFGKRVFLLTDSGKRIDDSRVDQEVLHRLLNEEPKSSDELTPHKGTDLLRIHNYYFEKIPLSLVDKVFM